MNSEALFLAQELEAPLGTVISSEVDRRAAAELRRLHAINEDLLALAYQYANDMRYPPTPDSRQRRLAAVEAVLAKVKS
jgi:hypothetical protein